MSIFPTSPASQIPVVFLDLGTPKPGSSCIQIDYPAVVEMGMTHHINLGHQRIAFIGGPMSLASARMRHCAFMESSACDH